jgi:carboxypeptidase C (cathepsin A)
MLQQSLFICKIYACISGHYVPQLAKLMIEMNKRNKIFNLKGIAVSNSTLMIFFFFYSLQFSSC